MQMIPNRATHHICSLKKSHPKNFWTHQLPMRKNCEPMKHLREKMLDPWNNHKKNFGPTNYPQEKGLDSWNTHKKKKFRNHKIPSRKKFRAHEGTMTRWHETHGIQHTYYMCWLIHFNYYNNFFRYCIGYIAPAKRLKN